MASIVTVTTADFERVLVALRAGDNAAWGGVVSELGGPLRAYLRLHGCEDPDNTLGEVLLDMARGIDRFHGDRGSLRAWAYTIARRRVIDTYRYRRRRPQRPVDPSELDSLLRSGGNVEEEALDRLGTEWVLDVLGSLTKLQRDVVALRFVAGLTISDVAEVMDTTEGAVKSHQRRALARLHRRLSIEDPDHRPSSASSAQVSEEADPTMDSR